DELLLHRAREVIPHLPGAVRAVEEEHRAGLGRLQHVEALEERELVAGHERRACDEVRGPDGPGPEAQMRDRDRAGLLAVVYEVALGVASRFLTDDLDGVLVRPDGAVGAEAVEDRAHGVRRLRREPGVPGKA